MRAFLGREPAHTLSYILWWSAFLQGSCFPHPPRRPRYQSPLPEPLQDPPGPKPKVSEGGRRGWAQATCSSIGSSGSSKSTGSSCISSLSDMLSSTFFDGEQTSAQSCRFHKKRKKKTFFRVRNSPRPLQVHDDIMYIFFNNCVMRNCHVHICSIASS